MTSLERGQWRRGSGACQLLMPGHNAPWKTRADYGKCQRVSVQRPVQHPRILIIIDWFCISGGAGGKGVWGKLGSEIDDDVDMDTNDPNYDSDSLENGTVELKKIIPEVCVCFFLLTKQNITCYKRGRCFSMF